MKLTFEIERIDPTDDLTEDEILDKIESSEAYLDFNNNEVYVETDDANMKLSVNLRGLCLVLKDNLLFK